MPALAEYPTTALDPFAPEFLRDPYPGHRELRDLGPVVRLERYDAWACARYDDVRAVLADAETYASGAGVGLSNLHRETHWRKPSILLENDPPDHTRVRRALTSVLTAKNIRKLRDLFESKAVELVDRVVELGTFDAVEDFAKPFPLRVFPDAVGLVDENRDLLIAYGRMVFDGMGPRNAVYDQVMADADRTVEWITAQCRRDALRPGGLGAQVYETVDSGELTEDEGALVVRSFLSAGVDTTIHALASAMLCLARDPEQWRLVREDPSRAKFAFEETLRYESPFQQFFRTTTRETTIGDVTLEPEEKLLVLPAAANRDPRHWTDPDRFDITRRPLAHLGLGHGVHSCVGQMIARLEGEVLLTELSRRVEELHVVGEARWGQSNTLRGLAHLPVEVRPAPRETAGRAGN